jgi:hypothetical protein
LGRWSWRNPRAVSPTGARTFIKSYKRPLPATNPVTTRTRCRTLRTSLLEPAQAPVPWQRARPLSRQLSPASCAVTLLSASSTAASEPSRARSLRKLPLDTPGRPLVLSRRDR